MERKRNMNGLGLISLNGLGLISLRDCFTTCKGNSITVLYIKRNNLTNLEGCPKNLKSLFCSGNKLISLKGCPENLEKLFCSDNQLITLRELPKSVKIINYDNNPLLSLFQKEEQEIHEINFNIDNFIKSVKKEKNIINFNDLKNIWLQDFYKPDGMYVQLTDIYFR